MNLKAQSELASVTKLSSEHSNAHIARSIWASDIVDSSILTIVNMALLQVGKFLLLLIGDQGGGELSIGNLLKCSIFQAVGLMLGFFLIFEIFSLLNRTNIMKGIILTNHRYKGIGETEEEKKLQLCITNGKILINHTCKGIGEKLQF